MFTWPNKQKQQAGWNYIWFYPQRMHNLQVCFKRQEHQLIVWTEMFLYIQSNSWRKCTSWIFVFFYLLNFGKFVYVDKVVHPEAVQGYRNGTGFSNFNWILRWFYKKNMKHVPINSIYESGAIFDVKIAFATWQLFSNYPSKYTDLLVLKRE
jgi:hypothetical protein